MPGKDIVVIGASAGGIDALRRLAAALPRDYTGSVFVVLHTGADSPEILAKIIDDAGPLPAATPLHGERILPGRVYVAPPDHHMLIVRGRVELTRGPRENRFRPAVDPLFRSAAQTYGPRVVGVILTGGMDDGTNGLWTVKRLGGTAVVQDPAEAAAPAMPRSALRHVRVDHTVRLDELAPLLARLAITPADVPEGVPAVPDEVSIEVSIAKEMKGTEAGVTKLGQASIYACPECHGVLLQMKDAVPTRFRCHTGHAYTLDTLLEEMNATIEDALWNAIRALEERAMLLRQAGKHAHDAQEGRTLLDAAEEAERRAALVRRAAMEDREEQEEGGG